MNRKIIKKVNQTVDQIAQKTFKLDQNDSNISRYSKSMLFSARATPKLQPLNNKQKLSLSKLNQSLNLMKMTSAQKQNTSKRRVRVQSKIKRIRQSSYNLFSKSVGVQFLQQQKNQLYNNDQLFLTQQGGFNLAHSNQFETYRNKTAGLRFDSKWTFQQFINALYIQKTKDLKTKPNFKQQKLFAQRLKQKFVCFDYDEISTFVEYGRQSNFIIKQVNVASTDFGFNSIKCICEYILSKRIHRVSISEVHNLCNVKSLVLDKNPLGDEGIFVLSQAMAFFKVLQKLSIVSVNMSPKGAKQLLKSLMGHQNLKFIDFSSVQGLNRNRFGDSIKQIELILSHPTFSWEYVNLKNTNFGQNGLNMMSNGITKNTPIRQLYLSHNDIKHNQMQYFLCKFKFTNLTSLFLQGNRIGDEGFRLISQTIGYQYGHNTFSRSLKILNVSNNQITSYGIESFCKKMSNNQSLTEIYLANNYFSKGQQFCNFKYFISKNWTLKKIDMSYCFTNLQDLRHLFQGLQQNRALQELNVSKNNISLESFGFLAKMLAVNKGLKTIDLESCNISDKYFQKFQKDLKQVKGIQQINLNNNFLSDKSSKILIQMIGRGKSIVKVSYNKNCLGVKSQSQICSLVRSNKTRKQNSKIDEKQMQYLKYVAQIQTNHEQSIKNTIQKLQKQQQKVKYTSLICQLVKVEIDQQQKRKQMQEQMIKIRQLQEKLKKSQLKK